jgi:hypothetical protein
MKETNQQLTRKKLEQDIIDNAKKIQFNSEINSYEETTVGGFVVSWLALVDYYKHNNDSDISIEILREYINWKDNFYDIWKNPDIAEIYQEEAGEHLKELEYFIQLIIENVHSWLYPSGR